MMKVELYIDICELKAIELLERSASVFTAYDFESGHPGSNRKWGPINYKASITAQDLPEPSSLWGSTSVPEQLNIKAVTGAYKLIDGCSLALCSAIVSVVSAGICHRNTIDLIA